MTFKTSVFVLAMLGTVMAAGEEIKLAMGPAPMEYFSKIQAPFEKKTSIKLVFVQDSAGLGGDVIFKMVDKGIAEGGATGIGFDDWLDLMKEKQYPITDPKMFIPHSVGKGYIKVFMNKGIGLKKLSKKHLKGIFTGTVRNWKEVGGPDQPVVIILTPRQPATGKTFSKSVMDGENFVTEVKKAGDVNELKKMIAKEPGGIGFAPSYLADDTVSVPEIPKISRPFTFITKGMPSPRVKKLLDFIENEGKRFIQ